MRAQVVLTPVESKKFIANAVANMEVVQRAFKDGIIVLHPSSSTYFIVEALTGHRPKTNAWVCGIVTPKGTCVEMGMSSTMQSTSDIVTRGGGKDFRASWIIKNGEVTSNTPLKPVLKKMGPDDVYIKGVNAIDAQGKVGILLGSRGAEGGSSIVHVLAAQKEQGINVIFPVGFEKLIAVPIGQARQEALGRSLDYSMGKGCFLLPAEGTVVTEITAVDILSGATAIPIAAGGLGGAEGAIVMVLKGEKEQVEKAIRYIEQAKGARLPSVRLPDCLDCFQTCLFHVGDKHWA